MPKKNIFGVISKARSGVITLPSATTGTSSTAANFLARSRSGFSRSRVYLVYLDKVVEMMSAPAW